MNSLEMKKKEKEYILQTYNRNDLCLTSGKGAICYTPEGKELIDFSSGIGVNSLGFCDTGWVEAISKQAAMLQHVSNLFYTEPCVNVAEMLVERSGMKRVFFANSGAEANEGAIKTARKYGNTKYGNGRNEIITLDNSFHGRTMATITATGQKHYHKFFDPFVQGFTYIEANDLSQLQDSINDKTCAIIIETVQGEGGVLPLDKNYVKQVEQLCKDKDILFIIDEVQTGIGRTGTLFSYEQFDVTPDIVTVAKGLGAGLPIGAVLFGEKCENVLVYGDHGTTFGANPVTCAGAEYVLHKIDADFLQEVSKKGEYIKSAIGAMPGVKEVSGLGMMLGVSLEGKTAGEVVTNCIQEGLLLLTAKDRVRLLPPLTITYEEMDKGLEILKKVLSA
ncbi:aspartate aminotransferase family protein [Clostridium aminobutyricum]|uniref:Acetylornithine aminotransferase n=1 Tax=Clostridium aminobutyricum TaxID=33953 RepID=A0A939II59_CLOAM|nr:aspartate aminotransferase family protein [Clostridium aminobutyricum]MBN7772154.1 aspartate aminotransferase family protein [Clostridium aminobutyricum]